MDDKVSDSVELRSADHALIKSDTLLPVIRQAHGGQITAINSWRCTEISGGTGAGAVYRLSGKGQVKGESTDWSVILKIFKPASNAGNAINMTDWNYYKREADAYRSGFLSDLPGAIAAPRRLGETEFSDGACCLWLEDIRDGLEQWTLDDYGRVARDIGRFNGAYLTDTPLAQYPWLSSNWIRNYVSWSAAALEPLRKSLDHPLVRRWYPGKSSAHLFQLWDQREIYFNAMDQLPRTLCHFDLFRRNLLLRDNANALNRTMAIDWAYAGTGCVGADISPLVIASLAFFEVGLDKARELDQIVFDEYLQGLRQAGWKGDHRQARLGYLIANIRYSFAQIGYWLSGVFDDKARGVIEQAFGHRLGEILDYFAALRNVVSFMGDERIKLMNELKCG